MESISEGEEQRDHRGGSAGVRDCIGTTSGEAVGRSGHKSRNKNDDENIAECGGLEVVWGLTKNTLTLRYGSMAHIELTSRRGKAPLARTSSPGWVRTIVERAVMRAC